MQRFFPYFFHSKKSFFFFHPKIYLKKQTGVVVGFKSFAEKYGVDKNLPPDEFQKKLWAGMKSDFPKYEEEHVEKHFLNWFSDPENAMLPIVRFQVSTNSASSKGSSSIEQLVLPHVFQTKGPFNSTGLMFQIPLKVCFAVTVHKV